LERLKIVTEKLSKVSKIAIAIVDNSTQGKDTLNFVKDDLITVLEKNQETNWWKGKAKGKTGWFPADFVEAVVLKPFSVIILSFIYFNFIFYFTFF